MGDTAAQDGRPGVSRAMHAKTGLVCEASEIRGLNLGEDDVWLCTGDNCRVRMTPCCWKEAKPDGQPYRVSPHFRTWPTLEHTHDCNAANPDNPTAARDPEAPTGDRGTPRDIPDRVILKPRMSGGGADVAAGVAAEEDPGPRPGHAGSGDLKHSRSVRAIREACEAYAALGENHRRSLQVDGCDGRTYAECFVRLNTGGPELVGSPRVLYDELFMKPIRGGGRAGLDAEPLILPLLSEADTEGGPVRRRLVVDTEGWPEAWRCDLRDRVWEAVQEGWDAYLSGGPARPWVFFVGVEEWFGQATFRTGRYPAIEALCRDMPRQQRRFRERHRDGGAGRSPTQTRDAAEPAEEPPLPDLAADQPAVPGPLVAAGGVAPEPSGRSAAPSAPDAALPEARPGGAEPPAALDAEAAGFAWTAGTTPAAGGTDPEEGGGAAAPRDGRFLGPEGEGEAGAIGGGSSPSRLGHGPSPDGEAEAERAAARGPERGGGDADTERARSNGRALVDDGAEPPRPPDDRGASGDVAGASFRRRRTGLVETILAFFRRGA